MSLPSFHSHLVFEPTLQILKEQMDPVLTMLQSLTNAQQTFLTFWNDDYNAVCKRGEVHHHYEDLTAYQFRNKFEALHSDVIFIPNARFHTLVQDIRFFSEMDNCKNLFLLPLINSSDKRVGVLGLNMVSDESFDAVIHQIETVGKHIISIYNNFLLKDTSSNTNKGNIENVPASFLNFSLSTNGDLVECQYSKHLLKQHPALKTYTGNSPSLLESVLQMSLSNLCKMLLKSSSEQNIEYIYPYVEDGKQKRYFLVKINASTNRKGSFNCFASITDASVHYNYNAVLEQILFDISHVMRRPVVSMKGLTNLIDLDQFDREQIYDIAEKVKIVSNEMEEYILAMFKVYEAKQEAEYRL